jgi:flagellar basal-body rod protein FlgG
MSRSLDIGASGMLAQQLNVDAISNNIANMNTTGFKRQRVEFSDLMYQSSQRPGQVSAESGNTTPAGLQFGLGVRAAATYRIHEQGSLQTTNNVLDLAISGDGFFEVELPSGDSGYTRSGSFQLNENGELVTIQGFPVQPGFTIPDDAISIDIAEDGEVFVKTPNNPALTSLGQMTLTDFANPGGLEATGNNLFVETAASGSPITGNPASDQYGSILQGFLEGSNVDSVSEITSLITAQRAYEMNSKVITTSDEMMSTTSQLR